MRSPIPLVVDLDGTLLSTDTLWEALWRVLSRRPWYVLSLIPRLRAGRAAFKWSLADEMVQGVPRYPVNNAVLHYLQDAVRQGRPVYLATAAPRPVAEAVARRFPFFAAVLGSGPGHNLAGEAKARRLREEFSSGFDYIGDSEADLPVWQVARRAIIVGGGPALHEKVHASNTDCEILPAYSPCRRDYASALRLYQWIKNLLVFVPMLLAHEFNLAALCSALSAFFSLSCMASTIYIINDLCDLDSDRLHPRKRSRPFAAGKIPLYRAPLCAGAALAATLVPCLFLPGAFILWLLIYSATTLAYSLFFKKRLFADVIILAGLYVLRIAAGAAAVDVGISNWLLAFAAFFFLGLALLKRTSGLALLKEDEQASGRSYLAQDRPILETMAVCSGFAAFVIITLYINSLQALLLYSRPEYLWAACPVLVYWYGRMLILGHRGLLHDDPVAFALSDKISLFSLLTLFLTLILSL